MLHWWIEWLNKEKQELREEINILHKMDEKQQFHEHELIRAHNSEIEEMKMNLDRKEYLLQYTE